MKARQVSPLDRSSENKLVAVMEAVEGKLTRAQIWDRVGNDFSDEEGLAKALGRLVASGSLVREARTRPHGGVDFVYGAPGRLDKIAAAATKAQPAAPVEATPTEETPMAGKHGALRQRVRDWFTVARGFVAKSECADALGVTTSALSYHVQAMVSQGELQVAGATSQRKYAHPKVPAITPADKVTPAKTEKTPRAKPRRAPRAAPSPNLADFGASERRQLPVPRPTPTMGKIRWAIEDSGMVAIHDGDKTIHLAPADINYGVDFLEKTQLIWKQPA